MMGRVVACRWSTCGVVLLLPMKDTSGHGANAYVAKSKA